MSGVSKPIRLHLPLGGCGFRTRTWDLPVINGKAVNGSGYRI